MTYSITKSICIHHEEDGWDDFLTSLFQIIIGVKMTETKLCKETIKVLIEVLNEDFEKNTNSFEPPSDWDRGRKSGIGAAIWTLNQFLK